MPRRAARLLIVVTLLISAWLVSHAVLAELDVVWLSLVPVFALALPLVAGRYPGEETIARLASAVRASPRKPVLAAVAAAPRARAARVGSGLLLACHVAGRAPPRPALAA